MIEDKPKNRKRVRIHEEDNITISSCKTTDYVSGSIEDDYFIDIMDVDHSTSKSSQGSQKPSTWY